MKRACGNNMIYSDFVRYVKNINWQTSVRNALAPSPSHNRGPDTILFHCPSQRALVCNANIVIVIYDFGKVVDSRAHVCVCCILFTFIYYIILYVYKRGVGKIFFVRKTDERKFSVVKMDAYIARVRFLDG